MVWLRVRMLCISWGSCVTGCLLIWRSGKGPVSRSVEVAPHRQPHRERGLARLGRKADPAPGLVHHDVTADVQPQAGALARRFGGEERLEKTPLDLRRDAGAVVGDLDQDA